MSPLNILKIESYLPQPGGRKTAVKTQSFVDIILFIVLDLLKVSTKLDNMDIQTDVSSQFDFNTVNLTIQSDISSNITNICSKNTIYDHGKVVWLQNFQD